MERRQGKICKWGRSKGGYGFLVGQDENGAADLNQDWTFFHYNDILTDDPERCPHIGDNVSYTESWDYKTGKPCAREVRWTDEEW